MAHRPDLAISVSNYSRRYSTTPCANVLLDEVVLNFFKSPALWAGLFTEPMRDGIQYFKCDPGFQVGLGLRERFQLVIRRHHHGIAIDLPLLPLRISSGFGKEAGPMEVQVRRKMLVVEGIHQ